MKQGLSPFEQVIKHLAEELSSIRTGRAHPGLVEALMVKAYNTSLPLVQIASITSADPRTLIVQPWDTHIIKDIERALQQADLGVTAMNDGTVIRIIVPTLTEERRQEYLKVLSTKLEHARVAIRKIREHTLNRLRQDKQAGTLSEDDFFLRNKDIQREVDHYIELVTNLGKKKEHELTTV